MLKEKLKRLKTLTAQESRLPNDQFFGYFVHGLKDGIRGRVRSLHTLGPLFQSRMMKSGNSSGVRAWMEWTSRPSAKQCWGKLRQPGRPNTN